MMIKEQTIFLDRDGVINRNRARGDYVKTWEEFEFLPAGPGRIADLGREPLPLLVGQFIAPHTHEVQTGRFCGLITDQTNRLPGYSTRIPAPLL